jgi:OPA family glycerol-3-phosphate transporter-like MFS transporter
LVVGLVASASACIFFGLSSVGYLLMIAYVANGFAQSTGWPGTTKSMAEWTTPKDRGRVMGLWSTCYQLGGVAATAVCANLARAYGWRAAFLGPAIALVAIAVLVRLALKRGPFEPGRASGVEQLTPEIKAKRRSAQLRILKSITIYSYGFAYFSIKLVRYSLLFWLTWYLERSLGYEKVRAAYVSTSFEIGGFFGTLALGYLSDRYRLLPRSAFAIASLVLLAVALALYGSVGAQSVAMNVVLLAAIGFLLFGPDSLIAATASQDAGGPYAAGFAAGMVNGIGSIGAIFQEAVTRTVSSRYGWGALFNVFVVLAVAAAVCLLPSLRSRLRPVEDPL